MTQAQFQLSPSRRLPKYTNTADRRRDTEVYEMPGEVSPKELNNSSRTVVILSSLPMAQYEEKFQLIKKTLLVMISPKWLESPTLLV